jgi:hypothetical protein
VTAHDRGASIAALATRLLTIIDAGDKPERAVDLNAYAGALHCAEDILESVQEYVEFRVGGSD